MSYIANGRGFAGAAGKIPFSHGDANVDGTIGGALNQGTSIINAPYLSPYNNVDDARSGIQQAINDKALAGGGFILVPPKLFLLGTAGGNVGLTLKSRVWLVAQGPASILKLMDGADSHLIYVEADAVDCGIIGLTLDGNRANQSLTVHALRVAGVDGLTVAKCTIHSAVQYGMGIQGGTNKRVKIDKVYIYDTGGDGIDIKNKNDDNEDIQLSNITVKSWGGDGSFTSQAAIDCRGPVDATNIWINSPVAADAVGYRFRQGELLDVNGLGAHKSNLSNFRILMGAGATQIGLSVVARDVSLGQGYISGGLRGVAVQESGLSATGVKAEGASGDGWLFDAAGSGLDADKAVLTGCQSLNNGGDGFDIETASVELIGCNANGNTGFGARVQATAANCRIIGGDYSGNTAGSITNAGTGTRATAAIGYVTENYVESASLTLDSTGSKTAVIPHGLASTPDAKKCSIVHIRETAVADHAIGFYQIDSVDAVNITVRARVTTASATGGATFKLGVTVRL